MNQERHYDRVYPLTIALLTGWSVISVAAYIVGSPDQQMLVQKVWEMIITLVVGYWFGSSKGSKDKDKQ